MWADLPGPLGQHAAVGTWSLVPTTHLRRNSEIPPDKPQHEGRLRHPDSFRRSQGSTQQTAASSGHHDGVGAWAPAQLLGHPLDAGRSAPLSRDGVTDGHCEGGGPAATRLDGGVVREPVVEVGQ